MRYRRQRRGGKGLRDIKTTQRNGDVISTLCVHPDDHVLMISSSGKIQRIRVTDISEIGRNTQGVRIMRLDEGDKIASIARIPSEFAEEAALSPETPSAPDATPDAAPSAAESAEPSPPPPTE
jgi:DNA gyrase subunit A